MRFPDHMTIGEKYGPAMQIDDPEKAREYFEACVEHSMRTGRSRAEAEEIERCNLHTYAGFCRDDAIRRIERLFVSPARNTDPPTAHAAAVMVPEVRGDQRIKVFNFLCSRREWGATDFEMAEQLGILRTSAGKRRKELQEAKLVFTTGERRKTDSKATALVWVAQPEHWK